MPRGFGGWPFDGARAAPRTASVSVDGFSASYATFTSREAYRACLVLSLGLRIEGGPLALSVKDLSLLYEYWCYLATARTAHRYGHADGSTLVGLGEHVEGVAIRVFPAVQLRGKVVIGDAAAPCASAEVSLTDPVHRRAACAG